MSTRIRDWKQFQHFKDRRPPWIKLHRDILDRRDINMISDCSFRVLVGLWLLASEDKTMQGEIPEVDDISFRLRIEKTKVINALKEIDSLLDHDDINSISDRYQDDVPETEAEKEKNTKKEKSQIKRSVFNPPTIEDIKAYCSERGNKVDPDTWYDFYQSKGWMVGRNKMKDWKAAVRTWEKNSNETNQRNNGSCGEMHQDRYYIDHTDTNWDIAES